MSLQTVKFTSDQIQNAGRRPNRKYLNDDVSSADCPILLKFGYYAECKLRLGTGVVIKTENNTGGTVGLV